VRCPLVFVPCFTVFVSKLRLDFGSKPIERQLILSAQFLHNELPVRLAHRVAELENLPYGLSAKPHVLKVRDWYVESFKDLKAFPKVKDATNEQQFTSLLKHIYSRHRNVVPVMAMGVAGAAGTCTPTACSKCILPSFMFPTLCCFLCRIEAGTGAHNRT
jgi:Mitochondrial branched-chain alpha-ketoacid dehydrogenase kinase